MQWVSKKLLFFLFVLLLLVGSIVRPLFAQSVTTSLTVPPKTSDFQFSFAGTTATNVPQGTTLTYTITYGAQASANLSTSPVIEADFSSDTTDGTPTGTHVVDYVVGSATNGYGNTNPVVDLTNRTITWSISNLPAGTTNQSVTFQLKTNTNYTGSNPISFAIKANQHNEYVTLAQQTVTGTYVYNGASTSPTATPTPTPLATPTVTLTPTPTPSPVQIRDVSVVGLTATSATMSIATTQPAKVTLFYATSSKSLSQKITSAQSLPYTTLTLDSLTPQTTYYFQVVAATQTTTATSDIFTFQTPPTTEAFPSENTTTTIEVNNSIIHSQSLDPHHPTSQNVAILPTDQSFAFAYSLPSSFKPKEVEAVLRSVLGAKTFFAQQFTNIIVSMLQKQPGLYTASLHTPKTPGDYGIFVRIVSSNGTITEQQVVQLHIVPDVLVMDKTTHLPIANARIFFQYYNPMKKSYQPIDEVFGTITNPLYTNKDGRIKIVLPAGKYQVDVNALGYKKQSITFVLGTEAGQVYPTVLMVKQPIGIPALFTYFNNNIKDFLQGLNLWVQTVAGIARFMDLFMLLIITAFIIITYLAFVLKTGILLHTIPLFLEHHIHMLYSKHIPAASTILTSSLPGYIGDSTKNPITDCEIFVNNAKSLKTLYKTKTNKLGKFLIPDQLLQNPVILHVYKEGFAPFSQHIDKNTARPLVLSLAEGYHQPLSPLPLIKHIVYGIGEIVSAAFEVLLFSSLGFEFLLVHYLGFVQLTPYLLLSVINLVAWIFFVKETIERKILFS